jgi:hypothetical protein
LRDHLLRLTALLGAAAVLLAETLSPFHLLRRGPLALAWACVLAAGAFYAYRRRPPAPRFAFRPLETAIAAAIAGVAAIVGLTAVLSPPNSADAMSYHMPRVVYWAQAASVAFYPTPYFNQISLQPLAEYFMLHTYVLSGGDRLINLVTFGAFLASIVAVSALAGAMGLGSRGQAFAALFCATLPNGILQASGAKNEWMLSLWLACLAYFAVRRNALFTGLSAGLALATKATAYLFAPPLLAAALVWPGMRPAWRRMAVCLAAGILLINGPQYVRNFRLSGSVLGYDSAHGDGFFRWRNESLGLKSTVSNILRNASEQLGARSPRWNRAVYGAVLRLHKALGIDPQDPAATWRWATYEPPVNSNHEANAHNRWHLLLLAAALAFAAASRSRRWLLYGCAPLAGFLLFCFYLKWQPFLARLELPLFVLGAPLAAFALEKLRPRWLAVALALFLVNNARPMLFENWTRRLHGPGNLFVTSRDDNYFADMTHFHNRASYFEAADLTARSGCSLVGIDIGIYQLEYPFQALLLERNPATKFLHTGVTNASARYYPSPLPRPCAVLCLECAGSLEKMALYAPVGAPVVVGRSLIFLSVPNTPRTPKPPPAGGTPVSVPKR